MHIYMHFKCEHGIYYIIINNKHINKNIINISTIGFNSIRYAQYIIECGQSKDKNINNLCNRFIDFKLWKLNNSKALNEIRLKIK